MERPIAVANFFIQKSLDTGIPVTPMKLVKLIYIAHGWNLGITGHPLISEGIQAWKYGPVIKSIYYEFKHYRNNAITALQIDPGTTSCSITHDENVIRLLNKIWEIYSEFSAPQLSTMTHMEGTPWHTTLQKYGGKIVSDTIIPNDIIKEHYKGKVNARENSAAH